MDIEAGVPLPILSTPLLRNPLLVDATEEDILLFSHIKPLQGAALARVAGVLPEELHPQSKPSAPTQTSTAPPTQGPSYIVAPPSDTYNDPSLSQSLAHLAGLFPSVNSEMFTIVLNKVNGDLSAASAWMQSVSDVTKAKEVLLKAFPSAPTKEVESSLWHYKGDFLLSFYGLSRTFEHTEEWNDLKHARSRGVMDIDVPAPDFVYDDPATEAYEWQWWQIAVSIRAHRVADDPDVVKMWDQLAGISTATREITPRFVDYVYKLGQRNSVEPDFVTAVITLKAQPDFQAIEAVAGAATPCDPDSPRDAATTVLQVLLSDGYISPPAAAWLVIRMSGSPSMYITMAPLFLAFPKTRRKLWNDRNLHLSAWSVTNMKHRTGTNSPTGSRISAADAKSAYSNIIPPVKGKELHPMFSKGAKGKAPRTVRTRAQKKGEQEKKKKAEMSAARLAKKGEDITALIDSERALMVGERRRNKVLFSLVWSAMTVSYSGFFRIGNVLFPGLGKLCSSSRSCDVRLPSRCSCFMLPSPLTLAVGISPDGRCGQLPPQRTSSINLFFLVTSGAIPLLATMDFKLSTSRRPAQAVGYPAQSRGADGDGGGTAGTPPMGVGAIGVTNSQLCESPLLSVSQRSASSPNSDPRSLSMAGSSPEPNGREGVLLDGSGTMPSARSPTSQFSLKDRSFTIGTWNMAGQTTRVQGLLRRKIPFVEGLMKIEGLDLLVLTETHTASLATTKATNVLYQSGLDAAKAGVALVAPSDGGWACEGTELLIPGYAFLSRIRQKWSVESFWILCVYADNSSGEVSLRSFYSILADKLVGFITSLPTDSWLGCVAAGDWNTVEFPDDRTPCVQPSAARRSTMAVFKDVRTLCDAVDAVGDGAHPCYWTYRKGRTVGEVISRLDRIYVPQVGWRSHSPRCLDTNWSDHRVAVATLVVDTPKVQLAIPARRLPSLETLDKCPEFWANVLSVWETLTAPPAVVTLGTWTAFKKLVLERGVKYSSRRKAEKTADWKQVLREEMLTPDRLGTVLRQMHNSNPHKQQSRWAPVWQEAVLHRAPDPAPRRRAFVPSSASPWQVLVLGSSPKPERPVWYRVVPRVADQLDNRLAALCKATVAKMRRMAEKRTSEWFNLSSNQELDERGSRASISVEGLRRPEEPVASTDLKEMTRVARAYFQDLHTPE